MALLDGEVAHRGRRILILQGLLSVPRWLAGAWDSIFVIRDTQDLKLAATVIQHCVKPARVVWAGGEPPAAFVAAVGRMDAVTFLTVGERAPSAAQEWHAVFWTPDAMVEDVEGAVVQRMGTHHAARLRSVLKELRAAEVGLVWSSIGETDKRGALYWYDPAEEGPGKIALDPEEAAELLRSLADSLLNKR
jgi:hypothetical protein